MGKRSHTQQTKHDEKVKQIALQYQKQKFKVKADLPGFEQPTPIGKYKRIPDIEAIKGRKREIIEVETPKTLKGDKDQQATFRKHAAQKSNTKFRMELTE